MVGAEDEACVRALAMLASVAAAWKLLPEATRDRWIKSLESKVTALFRKEANQNDTEFPLEDEDTEET